MMVNEVKDFKPEHADKIISYGLNSKLMEIDAGFEDNRICNYSTKGNAYTMFVNGIPVFAIGIVILWDGVAEGWVIATNEMWKHPLGVAKAIKKDFARVAKENNITRVQSAIRKDFSEGQRFAEWLGLEKEGLMRKWGFDGSDQYMYARLF